MASADFLMDIPTPHDVSSTEATIRISPGISQLPSRLCLSDLRHGAPCKYWALLIYANSPHHGASYPLPVRQTSALPLTYSRFSVAQNALTVQLTLPLVGRVEDFHLQVSAPCRAHHVKKAALTCGFFFACDDLDQPDTPSTIAHAMAWHTMEK